MFVYRVFPDGWASVLEALAADTSPSGGDRPLQPPAQALRVSALTTVPVQIQQHPA
jgi:hypothetical protein